MTMNYLRKGDCLLSVAKGGDVRVAFVTDVNVEEGRFYAMLYFIYKEHIENLRSEVFYDVELSNYTLIHSDVVRDIAWKIWDAKRTATQIIDSAPHYVSFDDNVQTYKAYITVLGNYYVTKCTMLPDGRFVDAVVYKIDNSMFSRSHTFSLKDEVLGSRNFYISLQTFEKVENMYNRLYNQLIGILEGACGKASVKYCK